MRAQVVAGFLLGSVLAAQTAPVTEFNTVMMQSTYLITGPGVKPGTTSFGTGFLIGIPQNGKAVPVLVTAKHVFESIAGDMAYVQIRAKMPDGSYRASNVPLVLRIQGNPRYETHDTEDVAVTPFNPPHDPTEQILSIRDLAEDSTITNLYLHPGDEVFCLGYPLQVSGPGGFPILRSGRIGSYPLTPASVIKRILLDLFIYPGNSGGPVYFYYPNRPLPGGDGISVGLKAGLLGLVIQSASSAIPEFQDKPLNLGIVVPALFIREAIDKLLRNHPMPNFPTQ